MNKHNWHICPVYSGTGAPDFWQFQLGPLNAELNALELNYALVTHKESHSEQLASQD